MSMTYEKWEALAKESVQVGRHKTWGIFVGDETPIICKDDDVSEYLSEYTPAGYMSDVGYVFLSKKAVETLQNMDLLPFDDETAGE